MSSLAFLRNLRNTLIGLVRMVDAHIKELEQNETTATYTVGNLGVGRVDDDHDTGINL